MSLVLRRPARYVPDDAKPIERDLVRGAVHIGKFVNEDIEDPLRIIAVNFNIECNGQMHKTHHYYYMKNPDKNVLVIRRGQPFRITIHLSRKFCQRDYLTLVFYCKDLCKTAQELIEDNGITALSQIARVVTVTSTFGNKTKIVVPVIATSHYSIKSTSRWDAVCDYVGSNFIHVLVQFADDCIIGSWLMSVCLEQNSHVSWFHETRKVTINVIFNCNCKGDEVYLEHPAERAEFVEEFSGMLFVGCEKHVMVNFWHFGQYDEGVLDLAMQILLTTDALIDITDRCHADKVVQAIAHEILQSEKILKFSGKLQDDSWSAASRVIADYLAKKKPVIYNENKTAVAVLTSIFRALGIPTRPVSGYNIASNSFSQLPFKLPKDNPAKESVTSKSISASKFEESSTSVSSGSSKQSKPKTKKSQPKKLDSIFIVENLKAYEAWVETYTTRKDLGDAYKGWQAVSCSGPASVSAILECNYTKNYGTEAFCSMINSIYAYYSFNKAFKCFVPQNQVPGRLGIMINTKKAGTDGFGFVMIQDTYRCTREQLTEAQKSGYSAECLKIAEAHLTTPPTVMPQFIAKQAEGLAFHLTPIKHIMLGEAMPIHVYAATSDHRANWKASVSVDIFAVKPNGIILNKVKHSVMKLNNMIEGGSAKLTVPYSEYGSKIKLHGMFKVVAIAWASGTSEGFFLMDDFFIISIPPPTLLLSRDALTVSIINTLPITMKKVHIKLYEMGDSVPSVTLKVPMLKPTEKWEDMVDLNTAQAAPKALDGRLGIKVGFREKASAAYAEVLLSPQVARASRKYIPEGLFGENPMVACTFDPGDNFNPSKQLGVRVI